MENLHIYIRFGNEDIEHIVKGYLYSDGCYCPESNRTEWFDALECSSSHLNEDFKSFEKIDMKEVMSKAKEKYFQHPQTYALCHYVIKNNQVTNKKKGIDQINISCFVFNIGLSKMLWSTCGFQNVFRCDSFVLISQSKII